MHAKAKVFIIKKKSFSLEGSLQLYYLVQTESQAPLKNSMLALPRILKSESKNMRCFTMKTINGNALIVILELDIRVMALNTYIEDFMI